MAQLVIKRLAGYSIVSLATIVHDSICRFLSQYFESITWHSDIRDLKQTTAMATATRTWQNKRSYDQKQ